MHRPNQLTPKPHQKPNVVMREWLEKATPEDRKELAANAGTSVAHLGHIAAGRRNISAELAQRLAQASQVFGSRTLQLMQRDLCHACSVCPLIND